MLFALPLIGQSHLIFAVLPLFNFDELVLTLGQEWDGRGRPKKDTTDVFFREIYSITKLTRD